MSYFLPCLMAFLIPFVMLGSVGITIDILIDDSKFCIFEGGYPAPNYETFDDCFESYMQLKNQMILFPFIAGIVAGFFSCYKIYSEFKQFDLLFNSQNGLCADCSSSIVLEESVCFNDHLFCNDCGSKKESMQ